jgi:hypothetical protein
VKSGLRLINVYALLIATMVQGLTPGTYTVVSPWALQRLDIFASAGQADTRYTGIPENDRPAPSNDADHDGAPDESAIPNEHCIQAIHSQPPATPSNRMALANFFRAPHRFAGPRHPAALVTDSISSLCRMIC